MEDSIGSLLNQTIGFKNIQLILVNDGSSDNSEYVCLKYKKNYEKNIVYIRIDHKGVSKARNVGLRFAEGLIINFLDSDDKWDSEAFRYVFLFFKLHKNLALVGGRMKYFESSNNYHFLDYKFKITRVINLNEEYSYIQLSSSSSFFRRTLIHEKKFEEGIISGEDIRFISNILLINPIIGVIREAIYYYRKRSDSSSTMQINAENKNYYLETINLVQQYLINRSLSLYNKILPFIQYFIAYETLFRIKSEAYKFLDLDNYKIYCFVIENLLKQIDDKYILEQKIFPSNLKIFALSKKYNKDIRYDIILWKESFIYLNYNLLNLRNYRNIIVWRNFEFKDNKLHLEGEDRSWLPREKFYYFCKLGNKIFFPKYYYYSGYDFITMYGIVNKGRMVIFDIIIEKNNEQNLKFFISYMSKDIEIFPSIGAFIHIPPITNSYYISENYIIKNNNGYFTIYPYEKNLEKTLEHNYCIELERNRKEHLIPLRTEYLKKSKRNIPNNKTQIWLINDKKTEAGDNGEYFFRYLNYLKPNGIQFYFVITKNCSDFSRLKVFKNIIDYNSSEHLSLFLKADKIISSTTELWVNNPFGEDGKYISDLIHFDFIFLQNGVVKDDISKHLNRIIKNYDLLLTSSKREFKSFLNLNYGYNKGNLALTGLPRFDHLKRIQKVIKKEKIILLFPTWRLYIKGTKDLVTQDYIKSENFKKTKYYKFYDNLINDPILLNNMNKNNYTGIFCIHHNFSPQWIYFNQNNIFKVKEKCTQNELVKASLLITDYSSIFFDFGYLQKPVIYTQFDYDEYRNNHFPKGYFEYVKDGFGPVCYDMKCTINNIINEIKNNCRIKANFLRRIKKIFKYIDEQNCFRAYIEIKKSKYKNKVQPENINIINYAFVILIILRMLFSN